MRAVTETNVWRRCSTCRKDLAYKSGYYRCSVSTCNKKRTALYFCSVPCWDAHRAEANHRDAWAEEETAPTEEEWAEQRNATTRKASPKAKSGPAAKPPMVPPTPQGKVKTEVLVVASRFNAYVSQRSRYKTTESVLYPLSDHLREVCDEGVAAALRSERRTLMDRDLAPLFEGQDTGGEPESEKQVLVVVTRLKAYVKASSGMNTAESAVVVLSEHLRYLARRAIQEAGRANRTILLDRDVTAVLTGGRGEG